MTKKLLQMQNVDEVHIEYDVLSTSEAGIIQLKEKMAKIIARIQLEERRYKEMQESYFALKKYLDIAHTIKKQLEEAKQAGEIEVNFRRKIYRNYIIKERKI